jgi:hypothetical protein
MQTLTNTYNTYFQLNHEVSFNLGTVKNLEKGYFNFRSLLRSYFGKVLFVVPSWLFGFWLMRKRRFFEKLVRQNREMKLETTEDYLAYRKLLKQLEKLDSPFYQKLKNVDLKNAPWPYKLPLTELKKTSSHLSLFRKWTLSKLEQYNSPMFETKSTFELLPENEHWNNRNKAYTYWM